MIDFRKWINSIIWANWEKYRTVIPCACLLTLAAVVAFAIARDPLKFSLQNWQTLSSALVALGAAMLAYNAAMKKVRFDEQAARENLRRKTLGIFMRYHFAVDVLRYEAKNLLKDLPKSASENFSVAVDNLALSELPEIKEAWENLDYFSVRLSEEVVYRVQNDLYNIAQFKKDHAGKSFRSEYGMREHEELDGLRARLKTLHQNCIDAKPLLEDEIEKLRKQVI